MSQDWRARTENEERASDERASAPHYYWGDAPGRGPWVPSEPPRRVGVVAHRGGSGVRKWLVIAAVVALGLLLLKPLLVLTAVLIGALVGLLVLGALAVGALLLIGRLAFGWRWPGGNRWAGFNGPRAWGMTMRRGYGSPHQFD